MSEVIVRSVVAIPHGNSVKLDIGSMWRELGLLNAYVGSSTVNEFVLVNDKWEIHVVGLLIAGLLQWGLSYRKRWYLLVPSFFKRLLFTLSKILRLIVIPRAHLSGWNLYMLLNLEVVNGAFSLLNVFSGVFFTVHANDLVVCKSIFILHCLACSQRCFLLVLQEVTLLLMFVH